MRLEEGPGFVVDRQRDSLVENFPVVASLRGHDPQHDRVRQYVDGSVDYEGRSEFGVVAFALVPFRSLSGRDGDGCALRT